MYKYININGYTLIPMNGRVITSYSRGGGGVREGGGVRGGGGVR